MRRLELIRKSYWGRTCHFSCSLTRASEPTMSLSGLAVQCSSMSVELLSHSEDLGSCALPSSVLSVWHSPSSLPGSSFVILSLSPLSVSSSSPVNNYNSNVKSSSYHTNIRFVMFQWSQFWVTRHFSPLSTESKLWVPNIGNEKLQLHELQLIERNNRFTCALYVHQIRAWPLLLRISNKHFNKEITMDSINKVNLTGC